MRNPQIEQERYAMVLFEISVRPIHDQYVATPVRTSAHSSGEYRIHRGKWNNIAVLVVVYFPSSTMAENGSD